MKTWIATIKNKGLSFSPTTRATFVDYLAGHEGGTLEIRARKARKTVSRELRGFYWGAWLPFIRNLDDNLKGYSPDQLHSFLKYEFNGNDVYNPITKETARIVGSVMQDSIQTDEAFGYMERIRRWVAENYGEEMPDASEYVAMRDRHFEKDVPKVEHPQSNGETPDF